MRGRLLSFFIGFFLLLPAGVAYQPSCAKAASVKRATSPNKAGRLLEIATGKASFYSDRFHNRKTAAGERYDKTRLTAAHKSLPLGTVVRVTNLRNGRKVVVRINDRGPTHKDLIIDVSREAAENLKMLRQGIARVQMEVVSDRFGRSVDGNAFYVSLRPLQSPAEARTRLGALLSASEAPAKKRARTSVKKRGSKNGAAQTVAARQALSRAAVVTHEGLDKKKLFLGLGPFRSFREAEKIQRSLSPLASDADIVCLPTAETRVQAASPTLASTR